jgi:hypothetical protein
MVAGSVVEARVDTAGRRRFTVEEKRQIVAEYQAATDASGRGMLLTRSDNTAKSAIPDAEPGGVRRNSRAATRRTCGRC